MLRRLARAPIHRFISSPLAFLLREKPLAHYGHLEAQFLSTFHVAIVARPVALGAPFKKEEKKDY